MAPALCLLVARGVDNASLVISAYIKRVKVPMAAMIVVAVVTLAALPPLYDYYALPNKGQWREAVQLIESDPKPSDAIVIYPDGYRTPFDYCYRGNPSMIVPSGVVVQNGYPVADKERIWLVLLQYVSTRDAPIKQDLFTRHGNESLVLQKDLSIKRLCVQNAITESHTTQFKMLTRKLFCARLRAKCRQLQSEGVVR